MKKLLADFIGIKEEDIEVYKFKSTNYDLEYTSDGYGSSEYIKGDIYEPQYEVVTKLAERYYWVNLEELLVFIYNKR